MPRRPPVGRPLTGLAGLSLLGSLAACSGDFQAPSVAPPASSSSAVSSSPPPAASRPVVVMISIDGFNPSALDRTDLPALERMVREGASTLDARTAYEQTVTLPNHTGMLTGLTVEGTGGRPGHGVTYDDDRGTTVADAADGYVPSVFDVAHDRGLAIALHVSKTKLDLYDRSWGADHGAPDRVGPDDGPDKIDVYDQGAAADVTADLVRALADGPPDLAFLHLDRPDHAGHDVGFMSPGYLAACREADALVGDVLDAVAADPDLSRRTTVLLTADHGGLPGTTSHSDETSPADYTVPFLAWGAQVAPGADLYALNPGRQDPGTGRPTYAGPQPVRSLDLADLALDLLDLPPLPDAGVPGTSVLRVS